jgi:hypothetical protein
VGWGGESAQADLVCFVAANSFAKGSSRQIQTPHPKVSRCPLARVLDDARLAHGSIGGIGTEACRMAQLSTTLSGVAGEYFVAAELSRRGYIATMTLRNSRGIDILAADARQSVRIQVKTNQGSKRDWMIDRKVEAADETLFFVFVNLNDLNQAPSFHVVRGADVMAECKRQTQGLIDRNMDNSIRHFKDPEGLHLGRWDILGLDSTASI